MTSEAFFQYSYASAMPAYNTPSSSFPSYEPAPSPQSGGRKAHAPQQRKAHTPSELSRTNIYISGLKADTTDDDLRTLCQCFGEIISTKAIIDRESNVCKGYGFVMFEQETSAKAAIDTLVRNGAQATFAKMTRAQLEHQRGDVDPTNLYFTNLHRDFDESQLTTLIMHALGMSGEVVSCRVLRDEAGVSRGVGLARLDSREACEVVIVRLNGYMLSGCPEPMRVKYANGPSPRRPAKAGAARSLAADMGVPAGGDYLFEDQIDYPVVPDTYSPSTVHVGSPLGSRLSAWVGSPREESALAVPSTAASEADTAPYELDFADGLAEDFAHSVLDDPTA